MYSDLVCQYCQKVFKRYVFRKYCSRKCMGANKKGKLIPPNLVAHPYKPPKTGQYLNCLNCGKQYYKPQCIIDKRKTKYCSRDCSYTYRFKGTGKCKLCNKDISVGIYCSKECKNKYWDVTDYKIRKKDLHRRRKLELVKLLGNKCIKCGIDDIRVLDIDHIDPSLKVRPKNLHYPLNRRLKEWYDNISNLQLLCANCHRIHTWKQRNYYNFEKLIIQ